MKSSYSEFTDVHALPLARAPIAQLPVTLDEVEQAAEKAKRGGMWSVREAAIARSGLLESEVRDALGHASNVWAAYKQPRLNKDGTKNRNHKNFPEDQNAEFDRLVGNTLVTQVHAYLSGLECKRLQSAVERELEEMKRQLEEAKAREEYMIDVLAKVNGR